MGSRTGIANYEFRKNDVVKSVATEVLIVESELLEKTVAEDLKVVDPPNAKDIIEKAKAEKTPKKENEEDERKKDVELHPKDIEQSKSEI